MHSKKSSLYSEKEEVHNEIQKYTSPDKRQQISNELRLVW